MMHLEAPRSAQGSVRRDHVPSLSGQIVFGDNLAFLRTLQSETIDLIYIDPPFNTGHIQSRKQLITVRDDDTPDRIGFKGLGYRTHVVGQKAFRDIFENFEAFIIPRLEEAHRVLKPDGSLFFHINYREVHYCKIYLDKIFGRASFINEIVWAYDYGARSKTRWSPKHDNILWYAKNPKDYAFNFAAIDRIPYMAPGLVGPEKAARGKTPSDTWWHTIVSPTGREKTGYPTQKPLGIIERIVRLHSDPGDTVLDFFAGSGTVGEACGKLGRKFILVDNNAVAFEVMRQRLARFNPEVITLSGETKGSTSIAPSESTMQVQIIVSAGWKYDDAALPNLHGPQKDVEMVRQLFSNNSSLGMFTQAQINILENPTGQDLRSSLVNYADGRSATGDILIFYFSGHGLTLGGNQFGFCLKDTRIRPDGSCLSLSAVSFNEIVSTLVTAQVHPVFIIDACNSGKAGQTDPNELIEQMRKQIEGAAPTSFGLLCACYPEGLAVDTAQGGAFTKALFEVVKAGISDKTHRRQQYLTLEDLVGPVQRRLEQVGSPLPKWYGGKDLPRFPLVRNTAYQPISVTFSPYHRLILDLLWNRGKPSTVSLADISAKCGLGAYGNHSKLSLEPWSLVENVGDKRHRRLTKRGEQFMVGKLKIPNVIEKDPETNTWSPAKNAQKVAYSDIQVPKTLSSGTKSGGPKPAKKH